MLDDIKIGRRTFLKGTAATGALAMLAGCGMQNASAENTPSMFITNPVSIDPYNCQENQGTQVALQLFSTLTQYNYDTNQLEGLAATSWDVSPDAKTFTFHLVEGATFHNGEPVNSAAFKRGWERTVNPKTNPDSPSVVSYHLSMVEGYDALINGDATELSGVTCPDDYTLVVNLNQAYADFPYVTTHVATAPIPEVALNDFQAFFLAPVGNGPFQMDGKWVDGQYIRLKRYDNYFGEKAKINGINFVIQKDMETAYREFQAGNLDVCNIPTAQITSAEQTYGVSETGYTITPHHQVLLGDQISSYFIVVNNKDEVLKDPNLRKAISLAINRESICDNLFQGTRTPADGVVPPSIDGYQAGTWPLAHYDKAAAIKILDQYYPADANGDRDVSITLSFNGDGDHKSIMEHVQADLKEVGINATLDQTEWAALLNRYQSGDYQLGRMGWNSDYPILDNSLYPLFYTGNGDNQSGFSDPVIDAKLNAARSIVDPDKRIAALQEINRQIGAQMPVIPLFYYKLSMVGSDRIEYGYVTPRGDVEFDGFEMVTSE